MNENQKGYLILFLLVLAMMLHYGETDRLARMAGNPAEDYCLNQNYTSVIRQNSAGTYGVCIVNDVEWEEWNYYRIQVPAVLPNCTANTTVSVWNLINLTCTSVDACGADYITSFATEPQCRAVSGESPIETVVETDTNLFTWWILEGEVCNEVGPQSTAPEGDEVYNTESECNQRAEDKFKFTSEVNPNLIEYVKQMQEQQVSDLQRAEGETEEGPIWKSTKFWITLILLIIIAIIYGLWEKGPKRGFFRKGGKR